MTEVLLNNKWVKASVVGTVWAASEIVFGSFLHNLRIPFCGNILTAIGLIILISFAYTFKEKGIFWRAGLICALLKTLSPSAVIFGPMIAIFTEAVLLEIAVLILGRTYAGFIMGSVLAMAWNLVQKILSYILFYGFDIIEIYKGLVKIAENQLNHNFDLLWMPIIILLISYAVFGIVAAIIGIRVGKKISLKRDNPDDFYNEREIHKTQQVEIKYSLAWFFLNIASIICGLLLLGFTDWYISGSFITIISVIWSLRYRRALKKIANPKFWLVFVLITAITVFVFSALSSDDDYLVKGLLAGLDMNLRAVLMILGFAVLAVELYNPKIRDFFRRSSFNQLPKALELSLESLPVFVSAVPDFKTAIRNPVKVFYSIVINASKRLEQYQNPSSKTPQIIILSGKIADGKTTLAKKAYEHLTNRGINCGGFFSEKVFVNDVLVGYDVVDAVTHKREQILRVIECEECDRIGKYSVCEKGFLFGKQILENSFKMNELIIIDECGKMELEDKGWADFLKKINDNPGKKFILTIRDINVNDFIEKYQWENYLVVDVKKTSVDEVCRMIGKR
jgi:nucleoside-triphosphatase THEP1